MANAMRNSSLHIALSGTDSELDVKTRKKIKHTFENLFESSAEEVSDTVDSTVGEIIYEIRTPIVQDEYMIKEFFENLEVLFYELIEFNPHFTQFRRVDN